MISFIFDLPLIMLPLGTGIEESFLSALDHVFVLMS